MKPLGQLDYMGNYGDGVVGKSLNWTHRNQAGKGDRRASGRVSAPVPLTYSQEGRYRAKRLLVLALYDLCYNERQVGEIFRLHDWTMHLRVDLEKRAEAWLRFQSLAALQNGLEQYGGTGV